MIRHRFLALFFCGVVLSIFPAVFSIASDLPDINQVVDHLDKLYRSESSEAEVEMKIETPNWKRTLSMRMWSRGMNRTFIHILSPKKDAGISTLRIQTEMWNYFPKINKVMKVPPSMMMSSWMGSDFTNDDLVKESSFLDDYKASFYKESNPSPQLFYLQLTPKKDTATVWGKIVITLRKEDWIPVKQVYYDEKGNMLRVMELKEIRNFGNRKIPAVMEMTPLNKKGNKTTVRYLNATFDHGIPNKIFTLRNLQKRR